MGTVHCNVRAVFADADLFGVDNKTKQNLNESWITIFRYRRI